MRPILQIAHRLRRLALRIFRIETRGVKMMVFNEADELLLIRNSYARRHLFVLPGGAIGRRETPAEAAVREVREETSVKVERVEPRSIHASEAEGKRDTIHLFTGFTRDAPRADAREVEEARFFPLDALPDNVSAATLRRIAEYRGERPVSERW